ncbi:hypothetical protein XENOCAPTIV_012617 [Xenoophorus captivus]|uniref:ASD2 domain-containing protein n=1 Tax=Xenoophorus captivus TaxID=1517983 RepID=A0ABV0S395_9TELE
MRGVLQTMLKTEMLDDRKQGKKQSLLVRITLRYTANTKPRKILQRSKILSKGRMQQVKEALVDPSLWSPVENLVRRFLTHLPPEVKRSVNGSSNPALPLPPRQSFLVKAHPSSGKRRLRHSAFWMPTDLSKLFCFQDNHEFMYHTSQNKVSLRVIVLPLQFPNYYFVSSRGGTSHGLEREQKVDESSSETNYEVSLSCGVTTDPSLWILPPEKDLKEDLLNCQLTNNISDEPGSSISTKQTNDSSVCSSTSVSEAEVSQQKDEQKDLNLEAETVGEKEETEERGTPEGETDSSERSAKKPKWEELVKAVVKADHSLVRVLCPLANRKTALMLMEQLLSEDTLLMEEHYKKKQEQKGTVERISLCLVWTSRHLLVCYINEHLRSLEESRGALLTEVEENAALGEAMKLLVHEHCLPMELERYNLFIGDLERVVNLLLCLSARLARVQNALSVVDQHTDAEEKESLDSRHRLLCKQREDAKDLKDNLDRRENLVSTFLSRQLSAEQLQDYRRFVQTKASLLIRQKDLEEKQRLGEEQLEALSNCLNM